MRENGLIHLVDDEEAMRESLETMLSDAGYAVRSYSDGRDLVENAPGDGCVVSDVRMPNMDGLQLLRRLRAQRNTLPVVLMSGYADIDLAVAAMHAGAADFLEKPFMAEDLLAAISEAMMTAELIDADKEQIADLARSRLAGIPPRENEILERLVSGKSNKETAAELGLSPRTVEFHRAHILAKTGVRGLPQLVRLWIAAKS